MLDVSTVWGLKLPTEDSFWIEISSAFDALDLLGRIQVHSDDLKRPASMQRGPSVAIKLVIPEQGNSSTLGEEKRHHTTGPLSQEVILIHLA